MEHVFLNLDDMIYVLVHDIIIQGVHLKTK